MDKLRFPQTKTLCSYLRQSAFIRGCLSDSMAAYVVEAAALIARGLAPVQRLNARENAAGSENPSW